MRTAPSSGTQWFAREPKRCFAPHSKTASYARIHRSRRGAFGVRRASAALVRARSSGRDAQENPRRRCERMPGYGCLLVLRSTRQAADRTFARDAVVCSRTKAVLRTALQKSRCSRTKAVLSHRTPKLRATHGSIAHAAQLLECGAPAPLWFAHEAAGGMLRRIREGGVNECQGMAACSPRGARNRMRTAPSPGTQWFAREPKRCFAPHSKSPDAREPKRCCRTALQNCELRTDPSLTPRSFWSAARQRRFGSRTKQRAGCSGESAKAV